MTKKESLALKKGQRVRFILDHSVLGSVIANNRYCVEIQWDDKQHGFISHDDSHVIDREKAKL